MKKMISVLLVLALSLCLGINAFAVEIEEDGGEASADVKGTYVSGGTEATVYSVDITWGSMGFTYTSAFIGNWNPDTHVYDNSTEEKWTCDGNANKITVTNHSNANVEATLSYTPGGSYSIIDGNFDKDTIYLETAVGKTTENASTGSSLLTLSGKLDEDTEASTVIGSVTVTINQIYD
ncbi:MAG: hypothetical protein PHR14_07470 [Oscillospiraceae bacterium]|nr:hypothetical protein [Oscillospiraceae bacterium]